MKPTISIITVVRNGGATIGSCIESVQSQTVPVEHIIIDGLSTDSTMSTIDRFRYGISKVVSETDGGIYDAMNKGIKLATGEIIGILNADDLYASKDALSVVVREFSLKGVDSVFADLVYVKKNDINKVVRFYSSSNCTPDKFAFGWMPAHPTFFARRSCYEKFGLFKTDYKIAADYELLARFLWTHKISYSYIRKILVKMRDGGLSTKNLRSNIILNREIIRACAENNIKTNYFKVYSKYFTKIFQLVKPDRYLKL